MPVSAGRCNHADDYEQPGPKRSTVSTRTGHLWWQRSSFFQLGSGHCAFLAVIMFRVCGESFV